MSQVRSSVAELDRMRLWHPFTQQADWERDDPLVIAAGEGSWLIDENGRRYLDGNASLWVNVHGHRRPEIEAAVREQLDRIAHTTFLGLTNPPAVAFADALLETAPPGLTNVRRVQITMLSNRGGGTAAANFMDLSEFQVYGAP